MAGMLWDIFLFGRNQRMASLATTCLYLLCFLPLTGIWSTDSKTTNLVNEILDQTDAKNADLAISKFDKLEETLKDSEDPLVEGRKFLQSFIEEINVRYGFTLTIHDACKLVRENLHALQIPLEAQNALLMTIELLESDSGPSSSLKMNFDKTPEPHGLYWPTEWNWFGLNKKKKHNHQIKTNQSNPPLIETELPGNCYIGGCELLAGALVFILPLPGSSLIGLSLMGDGARRVIDGVVQLSDERRADPNYKPPQPPF